MKTARQNIVNQSEKSVAETIILTINCIIHSIKCFEKRDKKEKLRFTSGVTAAR